MPCEPQDHPTSQHKRVLAPTIPTEPLHIRMPSPAIDLDRQKHAGERDIHGVAAGLVAALPPGEPSTSQQTDEDSFRLGRGTIHSTSEECRSSCRAPAAKVPMVGLDQAGQADLSLQRSVEECGPPITKGDSGFEHSQRQAGHSDSACLNHVHIGEVAAAHLSARPGDQLPARWHCDFHDRPGFRPQAVPPRRRHTADRGMASGPQHCREQPHLIGQRVIGRQVDPRMHTPPGSARDQATDRRRAHACGQGLRPADHSGLSAKHHRHTHAEQSAGRCRQSVDRRRR